MDAKVIQAIMAGLVVLACIIGGVILLLNGIDTFVGIGLLVIAGGYLGIDLTPWIPLGKNQKQKGGG
ncbi:hypothetical protein ES705_16953 [subsurface metagenome]